MGSSIECAVRSVCVCICVCIRVLPFTAHVCGVLLCVRDRALHRVALAHGVFDRHAHKYTHTHTRAHMADTDIINAREYAGRGLERVCRHIQSMRPHIHR